MTEIDVGAELSEQVLIILNQLEPNAAALWSLVEEGYRTEWTFWVKAHSLEPYFALDRQLLDRLHGLPGDLLLDVMSQDLLDYAKACFEEGS